MAKEKLVNLRVLVAFAIGEMLIACGSVVTCTASQADSLKKAGLCDDSEAAVAYAKESKATEIDISSKNIGNDVKQGPETGGDPGDNPPADSDPTE